jgi:hypothetical protein
MRITRDIRLPAWVVIAPIYSRYGDWQRSPDGQAPVSRFGTYDVASAGMSFDEACLTRVMRRQAETVE